MVRSPYSATQLVKLSKSKPFGTVHDNCVGTWYINATFNDCCADKNVEPLMVEIPHHSFELNFRHLTMGYTNVTFRYQFSQMIGSSFDGAYLVVQDKYLTTSVNLADASFSS
jgi:hypothetical protein